MEPRLDPHDHLDSDAGLARAAAAGDDRAFADLVRRYTEPIYTLAIRTLGRPDDAEDAVQEVFLKAHRAIARFDSSRRFFPWLYTIALNHLRSIRRRPWFRLSRTTLPVDDALLAGSRRLEPEAQLLSKETRELVARALDTLGPNERRVFELRQLEDLSTAETARLLDMPENTVKTHLRRGRAKIADFLTASETDSDFPRREG